MPAGLAWLLACGPAEPPTPEPVPESEPEPEPEPLLARLDSQQELERAIGGLGWTPEACSEHAGPLSLTMRCDATQDGQHAQIMVARYLEPGPWIPPPGVDRRILGTALVEVQAAHQEKADTLLAVLMPKEGRRPRWKAVAERLEGAGWAMADDCTRSWGCEIRGAEGLIGTVVLEEPGGLPLPEAGTGLSSWQRSGGWRVVVWVPAPDAQADLLAGLSGL